MESNLRIRVLELKKEISEDLKVAASTKQEGRLGRLFNVISNFDSLASTLYEARAKLQPSDPLRGQVEDIVGGLSRDLVNLQQQDKSVESPYDQFRKRYRLVWREHFPLFLLTVFMFIGSCIIGYELTTQYPEFVSVVLPQSLIEDILQKKAWFKQLEDSPLIGGFQIAVNNIGVSVRCFLGGALLGIGGMVLLIFNGVLFGAIMGFCASHGFREALTTFVTGHGPLELSIIVAAAFSGFILGAAFYKRPLSLFRFRIAKAAVEAGYMLMGILPWLILAASIESFVSPWDGIPFKFKFVLGLTCAMAFWIWTFLPVPKHGKNAANEDKVSQ